MTEFTEFYGGRDSGFLQVAGSQASWNNVHLADAEDAKQQGGMIALRLRDSDAQMLAIPGAEPVEDLHVTVLFFGSEVQPAIPSAIADACNYAILNFTTIYGNIFSHAEFNPNTPDACAVYLVSGSSDFTELRDMLQRELLGKIEIPEQHEPYIPHITMGYGLSTNMLSYTGEVCFDRITVNWAGQQLVYPL